VSAPDWLTARPIAHRGLHDRAAGLIENSKSAALAAIAGGYAIECDVQVSLDGEAMVFHDDALDRLTDATGAVAASPARALAALTLKGGADRVMRLGDFLALIDARAPLICEIKSRFDDDRRLAERVLALAQAYPGPLALKSFDPAVIAHLRASGAALPLGVVAVACYDAAEWAPMPAAMRGALAGFAHYPQTRPDFLSYRVSDLAARVPILCKHGLGMPVMAWTVRTPEAGDAARMRADQIIFEGFRP